MIISILEPLPTHIITSPLTSLCSFCNSHFELLILATEPVLNTHGFLWTLVKYTSIICISKYTFVHFAILLIRQVSRAVPLPVTISFVVEALSFKLEFSFGFLHGSDNLLAILLEVPLLSLCPLLETSGMVNHQHLMLFLDFYLRRFQHHEDLRNLFHYPLHIIVHHKVLVTWW